MRSTGFFGCRAGPGRAGEGGSSGKWAAGLIGARSQQGDKPRGPLALRTLQNAARQVRIGSKPARQQAVRATTGREHLMSPVEWYYAHGDQRAGPVLPAELKQLAAASELLPDDLVWREGMDQWVAARNVRGLFEEPASEGGETSSSAALPSVGHGNAPPNGRPAEGFQPVSAMPATAPGLLPRPGETALDRARPRSAGHPLEIVLDSLRAQFTVGFVDSTTKIFVTGGHYCLYVAMLASFGAALTLGVKARSFDQVLWGVLWVLLLAVGQYSAGRFCVALDRLNRTTTGHVSTTVFLDSFALLNMVAGLAILLGSAVLAVRNDVYPLVPLVLAGLVSFIVCEHLAFVSLNPETLNISVAADPRAGEEAIGMAAFLLKALLRLAPVAFGAGVVGGTLWLFYAYYQVFGSADLAVTGETAAVATWCIIGFAALPFVAYVLFLLFYLLVDVVRAVVSLPAKLDALRGENEQEPKE